MSSTSRPPHLSHGKFVLLLLCYTLWLYIVPPVQKVVAIIFATCYAGIEYTWYSLTIELPNGEVIFAPGNEKCREGHTTFQQFYSNVLYMPVFYFAFHEYVPHVWLRILLAPLNVWTLEIVEGYFLMFLHDGVNPAWTYTSKDAYFHGNIKLAFWKLWFILGVVLELATAAAPILLEA